ncbi:type IV pilus assembly protein PilC [Hydrogenispora ethanolica]|uniref:Type IV pilus assembly protein PilC n=1 Tax=Hydrogenispora ethanolica TaxID=1082276 RepID=A0A4R1RML0_HYDET|nr:type II secretion system F family protein [Hydrogenispora ethanolica]TCL67424.1 type IV pilus assembly protein PilC [Hydrogenispora ethanolica]
MPTYRYQARERSGKVKAGLIDANSEREAGARLRQDGLYITAIQPLLELRGRTQSNPNRKIKLRDLLLFTRQFAVLIRAGVNLVSCLNLLAQQNDNHHFAMIINQIRRDVEGGESLHGALSKHPRAFPAIYIHMVEAGEASGQLDTVLERLTQHLQRDMELRKKVIGSLTYPIIIALVAILSVTVLMVFVLPKLLETFTSAGIPLPLFTKMLMGFCYGVRDYWYIIFGLFFGGLFGFGAYRNTMPGRRATDKILYTMPVIGPVVQKLSIARFTRTLATLLESGIQITTGLEIVERLAGNMVVANAIKAARTSITKGTGFAQPLAELKVFPVLVTQMIGVGEETGELSNMLTEIADFYEREAEYAVTTLTTMIEPAIIVLMGGAVALIVAAVMLPMFEMNSGGLLR